MSWPHPIAAVAAGSTLLVPFSLAVGASDQLAVRIDRLLVHSITLTGLVGLVGASYLAHRARARARADRQREDAARPLDARGRGRRAAVGSRRANGSTELATRRVYGEGHAPDEVLRTFGSRLTRALPLDELLLQLAESLKATMNLEVAEVWTRGCRRHRARGVGARPRARR